MATHKPLVLAGGRPSVLPTGDSVSTDLIAGAIVMWPTSTIPDKWLICDGQTYDPADYPDLFSVLGTAYGGDGVTTFGVPDLRDRAAVGASVSKSLGSNGGAAAVSIGTNNMPSHSHGLSVSTGGGGGLVPISGGYLTTTDDEGSGYEAAIFSSSLVAPVTLVGISSIGGGQAMNVQNPYVALNYIIYAGA